MVAENERRSRDGDVNAIFVGDVVHARVSPKRHRLSYRVFALALDLDRIAETCAEVTGLSYNRWNIISVHDADHGDGKRAIADYARDALDAAGFAGAYERVVLVCYPRVFGYVFNPISTFYAIGQNGQLVALIYEVNNTYGERTSYIVAAGEADDTGIHRQRCAKAMSVSPFTDITGEYRFSMTAPGDPLLLGIQYRDKGRGLLRTHFRARKQALTSGNLLWHAFAYPFLTFKVIVAIHFEALRLFLKGVPLIRRRKGPTFKVVTEARPAPRN
jgi:DUF1365 family protein